jgi:hypothetical protein
VTNYYEQGSDRDQPLRVRGAVKLLRPLLLATSLALTTPAHATTDDLRSVAGMRDHYRVLIVFTPSLHDARLRAQQAIMAQLALEAARRDLLFVQVDPMTVIGASDKPDKLRRKFVVPVLNYHAILIDKDGRTLQESHGPMEAGAILHAIDTAPQRQLELHRAHMGKPVVDKS